MELLAYFDSVTGRVSALTSEVLTNCDLSFIKVKMGDVENLVNGLEIFDHYRIVLDNVSKEYCLKKVSTRDLNLMKDTIFKVPLAAGLSPDIDLSIVQDRKNNKWVLKMNDAIYQTLLSTQSSNLHRSVNLYVTEKEDPNILHSTITFKIDQFGDNREIEFKDVDAQSDVSVYCKKYFTSYAHIIK